jgi:2,4-dienoyl-CoA reductase-like NADH-dependent reductase (Old Yellow Enzyme family)
MDLFSKIKIRSVEARNRIVMSPMCTYSAINGMPTDFHLVHYGSRAIGGAGIVIIESTAVERTGRISIGDLQLFNDKHKKAFSKIAKFIKENGSIPGIELSHSGRKGGTYIPWKGSGKVGKNRGGWDTIAPSPIPFVETWPRPREISIEMIRNLEKKFAFSAKLAVESGIEIIELQAAHGFLIHEFLSPISNKRNDIYGGPIENRTRFLLEIIDEIRQTIPEDLPLFIRISGSDLTYGGLEIEDLVYLSKEAKEHGVDLIDCSSGGIIPNIELPTRRGYNVYISEKIRKVGILTSVVGLIFESKFANDIIERGNADLVTIGRALLRDPYWPIREGKKYWNIKLWPAQYERAFNMPLNLM